MYAHDHKRDQQRRPDRLQIGQMVMLEMIGFDRSMDVQIECAYVREIARS